MGNKDWAGVCLGGWARTTVAFVSRKLGWKAARSRVGSRAQPREIKQKPTSGVIAKIIFYAFIQVRLFLESVGCCLQTKIIFL